MNRPNFDVAVIGLGPVGELAALLLAREGLSVLALEREADVYPEPRVGVLDGEAMRTLQKAGVYERAIVDMLPGTGAQWMSPRGKVVVTTLPTEKPQGHPWITPIHQPALDRHLRSALAESGTADVRLSHTVTRLTQDSGGVDLEFLDARGALGQARAGIVLGCDGANSKVRQLIGATLVGSDFTDTWIVIDAKLPEPIPHIPYFQMWLDPAAPRLTGRLASGLHRWERKLMPGEDRDEMLSADAAQRIIGRDTDPDKAEIRRHLIYDFRAKCASQWRVDRVLLCGDAAHLMPPMVGQGLNSGIRDVTNLIWKVAAVLRSGAPLESLDTYEAERRPHAEAITNLSVRAGQLTTIGSAKAAAARDAVAGTVLRIPALRNAARQGRWRKPARYRRGLLSGRTSPLSPVGRLFPQPIVRTFEGEERLLDDVAGTGWRIIGWGDHPGESLSPRGQHLAETVLRATFVTFTEAGRRPTRPGARSDVLEDVEGVARPFFRRKPILLVRPDNYVYASLSRERLEEVLDQLARQIAPQWGGK
ncbi:bifunctional 3-(3-hydroxy-phenyl)propionate/3-hydroxycinnamic acid hydroxylase [Streptomyces neyagawaensis]|uniref:Bifunctional 3-(3-hydroxy-phenyl)propionate/3-hydroxycinnamic acid hydroxylase n=1 Tax=Streptomyces neyagawaensis TaxID=42238 RepID=A0ABV3AUN9_9ACTN